eukprot:scaffold126749_cov60-Phaeocystis_antarctica.AAC.1
MAWRGEGERGSGGTVSLPAVLESARTDPSRKSVWISSSENAPFHASPSTRPSSSTTWAVFTVGVGMSAVCLPARRSTDLGTRRRGRADGFGFGGGT